MKLSGFALALCLLGGPAQAKDASIERIERVRDASGVTARTVRGLSKTAFIETSTTHQIGGVRGRSWWRLYPSPGGGSDRVLLVYHPYGERVTALTPPDYRPRTLSVFDADLDPRFTRQALVFPLDADGPVYVRLDGARSPLQVAVETTGEHIADGLVHLRVISVVVGVLGGMTLVVLLFWLLLRERVYLLYAVAMLTQLLYLLCAYGEAYALPGLRWLARFGTAGVLATVTLSTAAACFFLIDLADLKQYARLPTRPLRWIGGYGSLALLLLLAMPWTRDRAWFPVVGNLTLLATNVLILLSLLVALWRGSRRAGYALLAWIPLVTLATARSVQLSGGAGMTPWIEYGLPCSLAFAAIVLVLALADRVRTVRRERDSAQQDAERDALTGALNRGGVVQRLEWELRRTRGSHRDLSAVFLDLDHFKRINDIYGHAVGDACLRALVRVASAEVLYSDHFGRLGGEEFLLVLPGSNRHQASDIAGRIRAGVHTQCAEVAGAPVGLTVSMGVAVAGPEDTVATLIARSDRAMYAAKHAGRNRVAVDPPTA